LPHGRLKEASHIKQLRYPAPTQFFKVERLSESFTQRFSARPTQSGVPRYAIASPCTDTLDDSDPGVPEHACYTLGKSWLIFAVPAVIECFNRRICDGPRFMESLLFEIRWLEDDESAYALRIQKALRSSKPLEAHNVLPKYG